MNQIVVTDRKFLCQHRNGVDFLTDPTTDFVSYLQGNSIEKLKVVQTVQVGTIVSAASLAQINAATVGAEIKLTHPFNSWSNEGLVVGNAIRVENTANGTFVNETVLNLNGNEMFITNTGPFFATLLTTDGDDYDKYVIKVTTVPTSLIFKYGFLQNGDPSINFNSQLTGEEQAYAANQIGAGFTTLPYLASQQSDLAVVQAKFDSTGADLYTHKFTITNVFQTVHYINLWLGNYLAETIPTEYGPGNSYRYLSEFNFGVNINNPNEGKVFLDDFQGGSLGIYNQNFANGSTNYTLESLLYTVSGFDVPALDADTVTSVTVVLKKNNGNWTAGVLAYLYHTKMPTTLEIDTLGTFDENFVFKSIQSTEGAVSVDNGFLKNYLIAIDGGDPTLLNITYDVEYSAAELAFIEDGFSYYMGIATEDGALSAIISDRATTHIDANEWVKTPDVSGLVTDNQIDFYNSAQDPALHTPSSNLNTWIDTIQKMKGSFKVTKEPLGLKGLLSPNILLENFKVELVARHSVDTDKFFTLSEYIFQLPPDLLMPVDGTNYQWMNLLGVNTLGVPATSDFNVVKIDAVVPAVYQNFQQFTWELGNEITWREWIQSLNIEDIAPEFYDNAEPNNNFNKRASNYSALLGYDIYMFATAEVRRVNTTTIYHMTSDKCTIANFDVALVPGWAQESYELLDENGDELSYLPVGKDVHIKVTLTNPGAALTLAEVGGEIVCEITEGSGRDYRLHTTEDWSELDNFLKPLAGETNVKITQLLAPNKIVLECLLKKEFIQLGVELEFYGHLNWDF